MRRKILQKLTLLALSATFLLQSCKDDAYLLEPTPVPNQSFTEECDTTSAMLTRGWKIINASYPRGGGVWQNGGDAIAPLFSAFSQNGSYAGFIGSPVGCVRTPVAADAAPNTLITNQGFANNWLVSPVKMMQNGDKIIFFTRAQILAGGPDSTDWGNRLQVRINKNNTSTNVGDIVAHWNWLYTNTTEEAYDNPGDFDVVLLDINRNVFEWHKDAVGSTTITSLVDGRIYSATTNLQAYPVRWTRFEAIVSGLSKPVEGRFAFRYFVPGGDPNTGYGSGIGIDKIEYKSVGY